MIRTVIRGWSQIVCWWLFFFVFAVFGRGQLPVVNHNGVRMYSPDKPFEHITLEECDGPGCGGGSGSISVNGSAVSNPNLSPSSPAAPNGNGNVIWAVSGSDVSAYFPYAVNAIPVSSFGAKGDYSAPGVGTDDTTAIQNCLNFLLSANNYNACLLDAGKYYRITSALSIPRGNIGIVGTDNQHGIAIDAASIDGIDMGGSLSFVFFRDFFIGRSVAPTGSAKNISLTNCGSCTIKEVLSYDGIYDLYAQGGANNLIADSHFAQSISNGTTVEYGLYFDGAQNSLVMRNVIASDGNFGGHFIGEVHTGSAMNDVDSDNLNVAGANIDLEFINSGSCPNGGLYDLNFSHTTLDQPTGTGAKALYVSNLCTGTNSSNAVGATLSGAWINGSVDIESSTGVRIDGQILGTGSTTVTVNSSTGNNITANWYDHASLIVSGSNGNTFAGEFNGSTGTAISLTNSSNNILPVNMVNLGAASGIVLDSTSSHNSIIANIGGSVTTPVSDSGTGNCISLNGSGCLVGITQPSTAPSGSCSVIGWAFSQDGHATFCNGSTWASKI